MEEMRKEEKKKKKKEKKKGRRRRRKERGRKKKKKEKYQNFHSFSSNQFMNQFILLPLPLLPLLPLPVTIFITLTPKMLLLSFSTNILNSLTSSSLPFSLQKSLISN